MWLLNPGVSLGIILITWRQGCDTYLNMIIWCTFKGDHLFLPEHLFQLYPDTLPSRFLIYSVRYTNGSLKDVDFALILLWCVQIGPRFKAANPSKDKPHNEDGFEKTSSTTLRHLLGDRWQVRASIAEIQVCLLNSGQCLLKVTRWPSGPKAEQWNGMAWECSHCSLSPAGQWPRSAQKTLLHWV